MKNLIGKLTITLAMTAFFSPIASADSNPLIPDPPIIPQTEEEEEYTACMLEALAGYDECMQVADGDPIEEDICAATRDFLIKKCEDGEGPGF